jgi:pimeloyl-ACP methyl ester carboxylesterase
MAKTRVNEHVELAYDSFGEGEPIVLIMGIGVQRIFWDDAFCRALANKGFRVIRFDNRDTGESSRCHALGTPDVGAAIMARVLGLKVKPKYTLDDMADDTVGLLDVLGLGKAHVVGMSLGGMVAQCLALRHPHRIQSLGILMSNSGEIWTGLPSPSAVRALLSKPPKTREGAREHIAKAFHALGASPHRTPVERMRELGALQFDRGISVRGFARQFTAALAAPPRTRALAKVTVPTIVIHGADDPLIRSFAARVAVSQIKGARLAIIDGLGHDLGPSVWKFTIDAIVDNARRSVPADAKAMGVLKAMMEPKVRVPFSKFVPDSESRGGPALLPTSSRSSATP